MWTEHEFSCSNFGCNSGLLLDLGFLICMKGGLAQQTLRTHPLDFGELELLSELASEHPAGGTVAEPKGSSWQLHKSLGSV